MVQQRTLERYRSEIAEISREAGIPVDKGKKLIDLLEERIIKNRRQPAPEPPEGAISQSEGARKYGVPQTTISGWVRDGIIPVLQNGYKVYIDESRLAEVAAAYHKKPGRGRRNVQKKFRPQAA